MNSYYETVRKKLNSSFRSLQPIQMSFGDIDNCELNKDCNNIKTAYRGCDIAVFNGDEPIEEVKEIKWYEPKKTFIKELHNSDYFDKELATKYPIVISLIVDVFDAIASYDYEKISIKYLKANEEKIYTKTFSDIVVINEISNNCMDDVVLTKEILIGAKKSFFKEKDRKQCKEKI